MLIGALEAGGTKMVCSIGNPEGGVLQRASFQTLTPDVTVPQIVDFIGKFDVKALGIGSFGPLDLNPASPTYGNITKTPKKSGSIIH
ncbi:MAG: ROK family protein [Christensenellales bacterium]